MRNDSKGQGQKRQDQLTRNSKDPAQRLQLPDTQFRRLSIEELHFLQEDSDSINRESILKYKYNPGKVNK